MIARQLMKLIPMTLAVVGLGVSAPLATEPPKIGVIEWLDIDANCVFLPVGEADPYDEDGGWQYVFMTDMSADFRGFMVIDGEDRNLTLDRRYIRDDFEMRRYEVKGTDYVVQAFMVPDAESSVIKRYSGALHVSNENGATAMAFHGDC